jgi:hypothetical protein
VIYRISEAERESQRPQCGDVIQLDYLFYYVHERFYALVSVDSNHVMREDGKDFFRSSIIVVMKKYRDRINRRGTD